MGNKLIELIRTAGSLFCQGQPVNDWHGAKTILLYISYNIMWVCMCVFVRGFVALCVKEEKITDIMYQIWLLTSVLSAFFRCLFNV
jgi:hypothetical protein